MKLDDYLKAIESGVRGLAIDTFGGFSADSIKDNKEFLEKINNDLERWYKQIKDGKLTKEDFEWLLRAKRDLFEMHTLEQRGIAVIKINDFKEKVLDLMVDTAFDMFY